MVSDALSKRVKAAACNINGKPTDILIFNLHSSLMVIVTQQQTIGALIQARNNDTTAVLGARIPPLSELHSLIATGLEREMNKPVTLSIALAPETCANMNTSALVSTARLIVSRVMSLDSK